MNTGNNNSDGMNGFIQITMDEYTKLSNEIWRLRKLLKEYGIDETPLAFPDTIKRSRLANNIISHGEIA